MQVQLFEENFERKRKKVGFSQQKRHNVPAQNIFYDFSPEYYIFHDQGCQMAYFKTKNPNWVNFGGPCY
jgi:hypothetical protein